MEVKDCATTALRRLRLGRRGYLPCHPITLARAPKPHSQSRKGLTVIPTGVLTGCRSLLLLYLVRDAPHPALASTSATRQRAPPRHTHADGHLAPLILHISAQGSNSLTSIPAGSFSGLTSLQKLYLVRDALNSALASQLASLATALRLANRHVDGRLAPFPPRAEQQPAHEHPGWVLQRPHELAGVVSRA